MMASFQQLLILVVGMALLLKLTLTFVFLWYVNEYRFDRMLIYLKTASGKWLYFTPLKIPPRSPKTIVLTFLVLATYLLLYLYLIRTWWLLLLTLILTFPIVSFWVLVLKIPTMVYHWFVIRIAYHKMRNYPNLLVVGVTGSFAKTTVKEIIAYLLMDKFNVVKTAESQNSLIAASELITKKLQPQVDVMVVEMGAYKKGEIASICRLVKPQFGIVTAVNAQHQDLFKNLENTVAAKYELIQHLTGQKTAIFNADNKYTFQMAQKTPKNYQIWLYSVRNSNEKHRKLVKDSRYLVAENIQVDLSGISFSLWFNKQKYQVRSQLVGAHQVQNILAAFALCLSLGMDMNRLIKRMATFPPLSGRVYVQKGINGSWFIDDTFNNNPDAAIAGLNILKLVKGKKILVMQPMKELGQFAAQSHTKVGTVASRICQKIWLTNENNFQDFIAKLGAKQTKVEIGSDKKIANWIRLNIKAGDGVLFKGKEAKPVLLKLLN